MSAKEFFGKDIREFRRINLELKGSFRVLNCERNEGCAEIQNIGHGGLMFISSSALAKGDSLNMIVYYREFEIPFNAKVVWTESLLGSSPEEFKYGIRYQSISILEQSYLSMIFGSL